LNVDNLVGLVAAEIIQEQTIQMGRCEGLGDCVASGECKAFPDLKAKMGPSVGLR